MVLSLPAFVEAFFATSLPAVRPRRRRAVAYMVLGLLLAPHLRRLKTLAGFVYSDRRHVGTISRRLKNPRWRTRDWYKALFRVVLAEARRLEDRRLAGLGREWIVALDTTYHGTTSERMENLIQQKAPRDPNVRNVRQHAFLFGLLMTDSGARLPLPRKSYHTKAYCRAHHKTYRTINDLAAAMLKELSVPPGVTVTVVADSAFDCEKLHRTCRKPGFRLIVPIDPNRCFADPETGEALPGAKVVGWARELPASAFDELVLTHGNESFGLIRRRHADNHRRTKTRRRYRLAAKTATVSRLGSCVVVASQKRNEKVRGRVGRPQQHRRWPTRSKRKRPRPQPWTYKVLACSDTSLSARDIVERYELRWQIELFFREIKSRLQFGCYVFQAFESVERYVDLLLMGMLFLEHLRIQQMHRGRGRLTVRTPWVTARTTDLLRLLESRCHSADLSLMARKMRTAGGREWLLATLRHPRVGVA